MPKPKSEKALDEIGRPTSDKARQLYDDKGGGPVNYASNKDIAKKASDYVSNTIGRIEMSRTYLVDRMTVFYTLWNGDSIADYFPTPRSVHSPEPFKAVETFVPRAADLLVGQPDWFRVSGTDEAGKRNAKTITNLLKAQLRKDKFYTKIRSVLRDTGVYGFCPAKVRWKQKRRTVIYNELQEKDPETPEDEGRELSIRRGVKTKIVQDGPTMEPVDPFDFYTDLRFRDHQESPGIVFKQMRFEDYLIQKRDSGEYVNVNKLIKPQDYDGTRDELTGPPGTISNPATFKDIRNASDGISIDIYQEKPAYRIYEIFEFWGKFDKSFDPAVNKQGTEKEFRIILGRKAHDQKTKGGWIALSICENPYWHGQRPVVVSHYVRRSHAFQSIGVIEPIVRLSAELDDSRNMALAARSLEAAPPLIATDEADLYTNNYLFEAGTVLRARSKDALSAVFIPKASESAWKAEQNIRADMRETTGMISTLQGTSDAASETATSVMNRTREANKRINEACKNIAEEFLVPMLEQFHSLNQQMITKEQLMEIVGEDGLTADFRKVSPEDVAGQVQFEITALPEIEIAGLKARMIDSYIDRAVAVEQIAPGTSRLKEMLKMSWRATFGSANIDDAFVDADAPINPRSALEENELFGVGHSPSVQPGENFLEHYKNHTAFVTSPIFEKWKPDAQKALLVHIRNTEMKLQEAQEAAAANVPPQMMAEQGIPPQGAPPASQAPRPANRGIGPVTTESQVRSSAASNSPRTPKESPE